MTKLEAALKKVGYIKVPNVITHTYSMEVAHVYAYLYDQQLYFEGNKTLDKDGFFFKRYEDIAGWCHTSTSKIKKIVKILEADGFIVTKRNQKGGENAKRYSIVTEALIEKNNKTDITGIAMERRDKLLFMRKKSINRYRENKRGRDEEIYIEESFAEQQEYMFDQEKEKK